MCNAASYSIKARGKIVKILPEKAETGSHRKRRRDQESRGGKVSARGPRRKEKTKAMSKKKRTSGRKGYGKLPDGVNGGPATAKTQTEMDRFETIKKSSSPSSIDVGHGGEIKDSKGYET